MPACCALVGDEGGLAVGRERAKGPVQPGEQGLGESRAGPAEGQSQGLHQGLQQRQNSLELPFWSLGGVGVAAAREGGTVMNYAAVTQPRPTGCCQHLVGSAPHPSANPKFQFCPPHMLAFPSAPPPAIRTGLPAWGPSLRVLGDPSLPAAAMSLGHRLQSLPREVDRKMRNGLWSEQARCAAQLSRC